MKKLCILTILSLASLFAGCTLMDSAPQRARRQLLTTDLLMREAVDDWDYIWLYERNSYMNPWHARVGY